QGKKFSAKQFHRESIRLPDQAHAQSLVKLAPAAHLIDFFCDGTHMNGAGKREPGLICREFGPSRP
ncbi:MAG TPA: hypothetical protein VJ993_01250, partial [Woeseiaceae bacterium]|nr:hypothetical protein [Woeseiaceae bacterium]